jgi:hypothetical protein
VMQAKPNAGGVLLTLVNESGEKREFQADHVVCGTGYRSELARLPFLDETLLSRINAVEGTPILSANFESSMPGLCREYVRSGTALCLRGRVCGSPRGSTFESSRQELGAVERDRGWLADTRDGASRGCSRRSLVNFGDLGKTLTAANGRWARRSADPAE